MSIELKPCPFCGGSDFEIVENGRIWSGMKYSEPVSVGVRHWCPATPGQPSRMIERVGRDEASAVTAWNTRHTLSQQPATGEPVVVQHRKPVIGWKGETIGYTAWMDGKGLDGWPHRELYDHPAPSVRAGVVRVPLQVLKDASEALGNFVSDHGWGDTDMQAMDNLDAYIARHEAIDAAMLAAKDTK